jgi:nuclear transport factor 2 (NTF2) superfamily protein
LTLRRRRNAKDKVQSAEESGQEPDHTQVTPAARSDTPFGNRLSFIKERISIPLTLPGDNWLLSASKQLVERLAPGLSPAYLYPLRLR